MRFPWWQHQLKEQPQRAGTRGPNRAPRLRTSGCRPSLEFLEDRIAPAGRLFAVPVGGTAIVELNPADGAVVRSFTAPEAPSTGAVGLAFDGSRLFYLHGGGSDRLYELNPDTGVVLDSDTLTAGSGSYDGLAVVAGLVYIQDYSTNQIFVFDPDSDAISYTLSPGVDLLGGLAGASSPGALIAPINGGNLIAELDPSTGDITHTFQPGFPYLYGAAVVDNEIYLGSGGSNTIFKYSRSGTLLGQITTVGPVSALAGDDTTPRPGPGTQFVNGNFETRNTAGWTVFNVQTGSSPGFQVYAGANPLASDLPAPPEGTFAAFDNHTNAGTYILYQDVVLTAGQFHTLSLQLYYNNRATQFVTPDTLSIAGGTNQQFRVDVIRPGSDLLSTGTDTVLLNLFRTDPGETQTQAPITVSADLSGFAGQAVRLRIAVADTIAPLFAAVDDVQLISSGTAPTGTVSGVKFNDLDGDGVRDGGEPGLEGWTIYADSNRNGRFDAGEPSAVTDASGSYTLTVPPGSYTLREVTQAGWVQTSPASSRLFAVRGTSNGATPTIYELDASGALLNSFAGPAPVSYVGPQGLADGGGSLFYIDGGQPQGGTGPHTLHELDSSTGAVLDSDALPATAEIAGLAYLNGLVYIQVHPTNEILVFDPSTDTIVRRFTVAADLMGGLAGAPDLGLVFSSNQNGQIFGIDPISGAVVRTLNTGAGALIGGLAYGNGELIGMPFSQNPAYRIDPQTGAVLGTLNLAGSGAVVGLGGDGTLARPYQITLAADQHLTGRDFGNQRDEGTVSGVKFNDLDGDGVRDSGEPGLPGWTIYADLDRDGRLDGGEPSTVTGADGSYSLTLPSGSHILREVAQPGWVQTSPLSYTLYATGGGGTQLVTIDPGTGRATTVGPFGSPQTWGGAFTSDGSFWVSLYSFDSARAQLARVDLATGIATTVGNPNWTGSPIIALEADAAGTLYGASLNGQFFRIDRTTGAATLVGSLGFTDIRDLAFDGAGALWAVRSNQLFRINPTTGAGTFVANITGTDAQVMGLMVHPGTGTFYVTTYSTTSALFTLDPLTGVATRVGDVLQTAYAQGGDFGVFDFHTVTVTPGAALPGRDFGNRADSGTVSGVKFNDLDGDGVRDGGEPGLEGWTIYADLNNNHQLDANEPSAVTGADGSYTLTLPSGSHVLREVAQAGWWQTSPTPDHLFVLRSTVTAALPPTISLLSSTGAVLNSFAAPAPVSTIGPQGLADAGRSLFYIDGRVLQGAVGPRTLYELDSTTGAVLDSDVLPVTADIDGLGYLGGLVYAQIHQTNEILVFDPTTDTVVRQFTVTADIQGGLTGAGDRGLLFASNPNGVIYAIDPSNGAVRRVLNPGVGPLLGGLAYHNGVLIAAPLSTQSQGYRIDPDTGAVLGTLTLGGTGAISALAGDGSDSAYRVTLAVDQTLTGVDFGNRLNSVPSAGNDSTSVGEDAVLTGPAPGVLANDTDTDSGDSRIVIAVNGNTATVGQMVTLLSGALLTLRADGSYTYNTNGKFNALRAGQTATDTFTYTMRDGQSASSTATVTVTINGANDAPTAVADTFSTNEDTSLSGNVVSNDSDPDQGDTRTVVAVQGTAAYVGQTFTLTSGALLTVNADGTFTYNPSGAFDYLRQGQTATDTFNYTMTDSAGAVSGNVVTITVTGVNDAPIAGADVGATDEDTNFSTFAPGVLTNDVDRDAGDTRIVIAVNGSAADVNRAVTLASGGRLTLRADGSYSYDPRGAFDHLNEGETATETVTYTMADGQGATAAATLTITIQGRGDTPVAGDDVGGTSEDTILTVPTPGLLANDTDADRGTTLTVTRVNAAGAVGQPILLPSGARVTVNANGSYVYDPNGAFETLGTGQTATDTFTYLVSDGTVIVDQGTVTITITGVNDAPVAAGPAFSTGEDTAVSGSVTASDVDGGALTFTVASGPTHGTLTLASDGTFTYTPVGNYNGPDAFTFQAFDGQTYSLPARVDLTVVASNDVPSATPVTITLPDDGEGTVTLTGADVETSTAGLAFTITSLPSADAVLLRPDGSVVAVGATFTGPVTLTYRLRFALGSFSDSFGFTVTDGGDPTGAANILTAAATVTVQGPPNSTGIVRVGGTAGADSLDVTRSASGTAVEVRLNGQLVGTSVPLTSVTQVRLFGRGGNDTLRLGGLAVAAYFDGGAGTDSFLLDGTTGADAFGIGESAIVFNGATVGVSAIEAVTVQGRDGNDTFTVTAIAPLSATLAGDVGLDVLLGATRDNIWEITGANAGILNGSLSFTGFENLTGGFASDTFVLRAAGTVSGTVNGGSGRDALDYSARTTAVTVDLKQGTATGTSRITALEMVFGGGGNDRLTGSDLADLLFGGAGNDTLTGGNGDDVLVGGDGADSLVGGEGYDLLLGGSGGDILKGGFGDDILIGARTAYDVPTASSITALDAVMQEWTPRDLDYITRRNNVTGTGLLGSATIFDDGVRDTLNGEQDQDWFFAWLGTSSDTYKDRKSNETVTPV